jgi:hypothetical protein
VWVTVAVDIDVGVFVIIDVVVFVEVGVPVFSLPAVGVGVWVFSLPTVGVGVSVFSLLAIGVGVSVFSLTAVGVVEAIFVSVLDGVLDPWVGLISGVFDSFPMAGVAAANPMAAAGGEFVADDRPSIGRTSSTATARMAAVPMAMRRWDRSVPGRIKYLLACAGRHAARNEPTSKCSLDIVNMAPFLRRQPGCECGRGERWRWEMTRFADCCVSTLST